MCTHTVQQRIFANIRELKFTWQVFEELTNLKYSSLSKLCISYLDINDDAGFLYSQTRVLGICGSLLAETKERCKLGSWDALMHLPKVAPDFQSTAN